MNKHVYYLAGPMTGYPGYNVAAFKRAAKFLRDQGHQVISPIEMDEEVYGEGCHERSDTAFQRAIDLRRDLTAILLYANAIAMLPGWEQSTGARAEWATAVAKPIRIFRYLNDI